MGRTIKLIGKASRGDKFLSILKTNNVFSTIANVFNDPYVTQGLDYGKTVINAYSTFAENPTWWNGVKGVFAILHELSSDTEIWAYDFFDDTEGWVQPFAKEFNDIIHDVLKKFPSSIIRTNNKSHTIKIHDVRGIEFGYVFNTKFSNGDVEKIYCRSTQLDAARETLCKLLWIDFGTSSLVMQKISKVGRSAPDTIAFNIDTTHKSLPSQRAADYSNYLKRCLDAGVHRSVMLYGPPGTGKSTTAKTIVETLGLRSFRIRVCEVGTIDSKTLYESIEIFQPEAIIFDDFDRTDNQENLLETLEYFHDRVKLVIATVNRRNRLDEALLRPGRFDELMLVKRMDDNVIKEMLGDDNLEAFESVKEWPIAFIQEYVKRTLFMSKADAITSMEELAERVARLDEFDDDVKHTRILRNDRLPAVSSRDDEPCVKLKLKA